ncbi:M67 family metallopeptidase [Paenibacillus ginsengarvi]|uniref:M67 family metallopeptidase n=1 Tax=Paenibacillus ginsengarvi TaxID=400777 RepID=UPI001315498F|nr:M67 family metallopeptidase [Paenibacillus ginsengarvi]
MQHIERSVLQAIAWHCRRELPREGCGVLLGSSQTHSANPAVITAWTPIANRAINPLASFRFDEAEWIAALYAAERDSLSVLGLFHSHPQTEAYPSEDDITGTAWDRMSYWIISYAPPYSPDSPNVRAYWLNSATNRIVPCPYKLF